MIMVLGNTLVTENQQVKINCVIEEKYRHFYSEN